MWPFSKREKPSIHFDFISDPKHVKEMEEEFKARISSFRATPPPACCPRFSKALEEKEIRYSYSDDDEIDETAWYIEDKWHLYYCPFCGKDIRGVGYGSFHKQIVP